MHNAVFTTSSLNGVQKLASAVISPTKRKIGGAIFVWLFLLLDAGQLFHNLSINGVQSAELRY
ncbi:hydrolase [Enterococcus faecium]|nr:hydrolase [Enterococcus faecium]PJO84698.1 hydrolase [Enterococcus faecium]RXA61030.1 hydrolase [Enterococcus faecium]RXA84110.1 hydrolase [Enterococcus faecium]TBV30661.1 hydrolase [Enterococcus faecium]